MVSSLTTFLLFQILGLCVNKQKIPTWNIQFIWTLLNSVLRRFLSIARWTILLWYLQLFEVSIAIWKWQQQGTMPVSISAPFSSINIILSCTMVYSLGFFLESQVLLEQITAQLGGALQDTSYRPLAPFIDPEAYLLSVNLWSSIWLLMHFTWGSLWRLLESYSWSRMHSTSSC